MHGTITKNTFEENAYSFNTEKIGELNDILIENNCGSLTDGYFSDSVFNDNFTATYIFFKDRNLELTDFGYEMNYSDGVFYGGYCDEVQEAKDNIDVVMKKLSEENNNQNENFNQYINEIIQSGKDPVEVIKSSKQTDYNSLDIGEGRVERFVNLYDEMNSLSSDIGSKDANTMIYEALKTGDISKIPDDGESRLTFQKICNEYTTTELNRYTTVLDNEISN